MAFQMLASLFGFGTAATPLAIELQREVDTLEQKTTGTLKAPTLEGLLAVQGALNEFKKKISSSSPHYAKVSSLETSVQTAIECLLAEASTSDLSPEPGPSLSAGFTTSTAAATAGANHPGLRNASANCWLNSFMQMVTIVPSLETAYREFAQYKLDNGSTADKSHAAEMLHQLELIKGDQAKNPPPRVSSADTQQIRLAFHHFFRNGHGEAIFSASASTHQDAQEAILNLMQSYEAVLRAMGRFSPPPACYRELVATRHFTAQGSSSLPDAELLALTRRDPLAPRAYSMLTAAGTSINSGMEYQISLPIQGRDRNVDSLLLKFFTGSETIPSEATYLGADDRLHKYTLSRESWHFTTPPEELIITAKRFARRMDGTLYKIDDEIPFQRVMSLPREATGGREEVHLELDSFIVHSGSLAFGHYISYKKIGGIWYEFNDSIVTPKTDAEIDQRLKVSYVHHYKRTRTAPAARIPAAVAPALPVVPGYRQMLVDSLKAVKTKQEEIALLTKFQESAAGIMELPEQVRNFLFGQVWLRDGMPDIYQYGEKKAKDDTSTLRLGCAPFLSAKGEGLSGQLLQVYKERLSILEMELTFRRLRALYEVLKDGSLPPEEAVKLYHELPAEIKAELDAPIYHCEAIKRGKAICNDPKYHNDYGRVAIEKDIRSLFDIEKESFESLFASSDSEAEKISLLLTLLENKEAEPSELEAAFKALSGALQDRIRGLVYHAHVLKLGREACKGENLIGKEPKKLLESVGGMEKSPLEIALEKASNTLAKREREYQRSQLQAYMELLGHRELSDMQLYQAFKQLDIPEAMKEKFFFLIEQSDGIHTASYGKDALRADPRKMLRIVEPVLAGPPLAEKGSNIIQQMIALLQ